MTNRTTREAVAIDEIINIIAQQTNTCLRPADFTVHLRLGDRYASIAPPKKQTRGFAQVHLAAAQSTPNILTLTSRDLSFVAQDARKIFKQGDFGVFTEDKHAT